MNASERTLPHNLEAERSVLGAIVASNILWGKVASVLSRDDFYRDAHRRIFDAMVQLVEHNSPIDFITLKNALMVRGDLDEVGGIVYVSSLTDGVPRTVNVEHYAAIVKENKRLRDVIFAGNAMITDAYASESSSGVIEQSVRQLLEVGTTDAHESTTLGAAVSQYISAFDGATGDVSGHKLGFVDVDQFFAAGVARKQMLIIAARPSMGKTTLALNIAEHIARTTTPVGIFSLEMGTQTLAETALARNAQVDLHRLKTKAISQKDSGRIAHAHEILHLLPIHIVEHVRTYTQFDAWCRRWRDEFGVQVVVLDYVQMMGGMQTRDRQQEMAYLSRSIKQTLKDLDMLGIIISQLSRAPEGRKDKRPGLSDLRDSGALEQDADVVLLIYRADAYNDDPNDADYGTAEIIIAKNRLGPVGMARLVFLREQLRFADMAHTI